MLRNGRIRKAVLTVALISGFLPAALADSRALGGRNAGIGLTLAQPPESEFRANALVTPSEFAPASELQMTEETFHRVEKVLVRTVEKDADIMVLVRNPSQAQAVQSSYRARGGDLKRLKTLVIPYDSFWYQDFGPIYSLEPSGTLVSNDFIYNRFGRTGDDAVPSRLGAQQGIINRKVSMDYEGGNFISDGHGTCFASTRIYEQNPRLTRDQVNALMRANLGCIRFVALAPLEDDDTYHIDLFAKLVDDRTFLVGDFVDHPRNKRLMDQNAQILLAMGYTVLRLPVRMPELGVYQTHINSFLINGHVLLPRYGIVEDQQAVELYERLGFNVLQVNAADLVSSGGAIHCVLRSKPKI